jgi:DNA helicase-2/ATP-dependent DNA helicase PcrA
MTSARVRTVFGARAYGVRSRFIGEIPEALTDREEQVSRGFSTGLGLRARLTSWSSPAEESFGLGSAPPAEAPVAYRMGDDVAHPTFGEGVVTGIEPGGIVVIRFSKDRSERKLVADLAPITKR